MISVKLQIKNERNFSKQKKILKIRRNLQMIIMVSLYYLINILISKQIVNSNMYKQVNFFLKKNLELKFLFKYIKSNGIIDQQEWN